MAPANKKHSSSPQQQQLNAAKQSRLWLAAAAGNMDALIDNLHASYGGVAQLDLQDDQGCSPLLIACQEGHLEVVHTLLSAGGCRVDQTSWTDGSGFRYPPLLIACMYGHVEAARILLSSGALVDIQTPRGTTPLLLACLEGHLEVTWVLLSAGAQVDLRDTQGLSPLFLACLRGHLKVTRALLSAGAQVDLRDMQGLSPLYHACQEGHLRERFYSLYQSRRVSWRWCMPLEVVHALGGGACPAVRRGTGRHAGGRRQLTPVCRRHS